MKKILKRTLNLLRMPHSLNFWLNSNFRVPFICVTLKMISSNMNLYMSVNVFIKFKVTMTNSRPSICKSKKRNFNCCDCVILPLLLFELHWKAYLWMIYLHEEHWWFWGVHSHCGPNKSVFNIRNDQMMNYIRILISTWVQNLDSAWDVIKWKLLPCSG